MFITSTCLGRPEPDRTGLDRTGPDRTGLDRTGPARTGLDPPEPARTGLDQTEPAWTGLDQPEPDWTSQTQTEPVLPAPPTVRCPQAGLGLERQQQAGEGHQENRGTRPLIGAVTLQCLLIGLIRSGRSLGRGQAAGGQSRAAGTQVVEVSGELRLPGLLSEGLPHSGCVAGATGQRGAGAHVEGIPGPGADTQTDGHTDRKTPAYTHRLTGGLVTHLTHTLGVTQLKCVLWKYVTQ